MVDSIDTKGRTLSVDGRFLHFRVEIRMDSLKIRGNKVSSFHFTSPQTVLSFDWREIVKVEVSQ